MSIWISNYRKLVFANNEEQVRLPNSDCNTLERMMKYMATFRLSRFELEVIKKDLIGMAEEAQLEKVELSDRIGMPEKEFCDRLVEDAARQSIAEQALPALRNSLLWLLGFYTLGWLIDGRPAHYGVLNSLIFETCIMAVVSLTDRWLTDRATYLGKWRRKFAGAAELVFWVALINASDLFIFSSSYNYFSGLIPEKFVIMGNGTVFFVIFAVLTAAVYLWGNYFYDRCMKRYQWE